MNKQTQQKGFLLVEILIALMVLVILVSIGAMILGISNDARSRAENYGVANSIAFAKIQEYELKDFPTIPNGVSGNNYEIEDFSADILASTDNKYNEASGKVYSKAVSGSLKKIWVHVDYTFGDLSDDVEYATYIQIGGVGR
jgi:type II secretory pathway pseudopilin PulG